MILLDTDHATLLKYPFADSVRDTFSASRPRVESALQPALGVAGIKSVS